MRTHHAMAPKAASAAVLPCSPLAGGLQGAMTGRTLSVVLALFVLAGCTYIEERRDLNAGGPQAREAAAQAQLDAERQRNASLSVQQQSREQELAAINAKLASAQMGLEDQQRRLDAALRARQISAAKYADLKRQTDSLKSDTASLKLRNDADRATKSSNANDPAKLKQLDALDQKRKDLEAALKAAVSQ